MPLVIFFFFLLLSIAWRWQSLYHPFNDWAGIQSEFGEPWHGRSK